MGNDVRTVTLWLVPVGLTLNTIALLMGGFTDNAVSGGLAVLRGVLQGGALVCFVVFFVRVWRARRRRLLAEEGTPPARDD